MADALTLQSLLTAQDAETIYETLLGVYASAGFPVSAWEDFGSEKTRLLAVATALAQVSGSQVPAIASWNFLDYASGNGLRLKAQQDFSIDYNQASNAVGQITLTSSASAPSYTITPGKIVVVFPSKRRWRLTGFIVAGVFTSTPQSLPSASSLVCVVTADSPGAIYNTDLNDSSITLATPLPGVTATNVAGAYSDVSHDGAGTGSISLGGSPVGSHSVVVSIDATGSAGAASWSYSLDGSPYVNAGTVSSLTIPGTGILISLVDGLSGTSFAEKDIYRFSTPGNWITTVGSDDESDDSLREACRNRWSTLSDAPTAGYYTLLAKRVPGVGGQVTQAIPIVDTVINNRINLVVAGPSGPLPGPTANTIQDYVTPRAIGCDRVVVVSPSTSSPTIEFAATVSASGLATAQAAINSALASYVLDSGINPTIQLSEIAFIVRGTVGVSNVDLSTVKINGVAADLVLGSSTTFVMASAPTINGTYVANG